MHIIQATRTHIGSFQGGLKDSSATDLGAATLKASLGNIDPNLIDEVIMGCVLSAGLGQAPARQAALKAGLLDSTPALSINKVCGSGMKAVMMACDQIALGKANFILAGGMESMSNSPYLLGKARQGYRFGHGQVLDHMLLDGLEDANLGGVSMGILAEQLTSCENFTRQEQDAFAIESLERARKANFKNEIIGDFQDEIPLKANIEKIPLLKPAFGGTITAASSSGLADGAASVLLASDEACLKHGLTSRGRIAGQSQFSCAPQDFTKAPVGAILKLLKSLNWEIDDVDLFEINEAFAVVPMYAAKTLKINPGKMNVNGGACALGHPIGASGARIIVTLLHAMEEHDHKKGIACACIGGGEAVAVAIER